MLLAAFSTLLALLGFSLTWTTLPVRSADAGTLDLSVYLSEDDLVSVSTQEGALVAYEVTVTLDGEDFRRRGSRVTNPSFPLIEVFSFSSLDAGEHTAVATLTDIETGETRHAEACPVVDEVAATRWSGSGVRVSPSGPVRAAGSISVLWTLYVPEGEEVPSAAFALLDSETEVAVEGWLTGDSRGAGIVDFSADVPLGGLSKGRYRLTVAALQNDTVVASSSGSVAIMESWDVWGNDPDETITLIRPIASTHEISELRRATSLGARNSVMADFWTRRDPNPATPENEYLDEYLTRLDKISREFSATGTRGINTDRGVVYAKLGEPDVIDRYPFDLGGYPHVTWQYFTPSIEVTFVDRDGYGLYQLEDGWDSVDRAFNSIAGWPQ